MGSAAFALTNVYGLHKGGFGIEMDCFASEVCREFHHGDAVEDGLATNHCAHPGK